MFELQHVLGRFTWAIFKGRDVCIFTSYLYESDSLLGVLIDYVKILYGR